MTHAEHVISEFKRRAIFFPKGRIVPRWILRLAKPHHKLSHRVKFDADCWVLPQGKNGAALAKDIGGNAIYINIPDAHINVKGSPYGGTLHFILNENWNYIVWANAMKQAMENVK